MSKETRLAVKESRIRYWNKVFEDRINSGLKPREHCDLHGITKDQYYYRLRKVREATLNESSIQLVEIREAPVLSVNTRDKKALTIKIADVVIEVDETTSQSLLADTIRTLRNA